MLEFSLQMEWWMSWRKIVWVNLLITKKSETSSEESLGDEDNNDGANCIENHLGSVKCQYLVSRSCPIYHHRSVLVLWWLVFFVRVCLSSKWSASVVPGSSLKISINTRLVKQVEAAVCERESVCRKWSTPHVRSPLYVLFEVVWFGSFTAVALMMAYSLFID